MKTKTETENEFDVRNRLSEKYSWRDVHKLLIELTDNLQSERDIQYYHGYSDDECKSLYSALSELRQMKV